MAHIRRQISRLAALIFALAFVSPALAEPRLGISMHGAPLYPDDFTHFSYANPDAPAGGTIRYGAVGTFDSLNPFIVRGTPAIGLRDYVFESLMARSYDEPFSLYGLIAESIDVPDDRSSVTFRLRPEARFSDGTPVTVDDVIFSLDILRDKGRPNYKSYFSKVAKIVRPDAQSVTFILRPEPDGSGPDRELPLIIGLMPILPKHVYETRKFDQSGFDMPVGSGRYTVASFKPGNRVIYQRNANYWGRNLSVNRGLGNFDKLQFDYFRDTNASFEAFKAGLYDVRPEDDPGRWATEFNFPAVRDGRVKQVTFATGLPSGMRGLVFNTRRKMFADKRVRVALTMLFDFQWANKTLYHGAYTRTQSYFDNSELSSHGRTADERERMLLKPFPAAVTPEIMAHGYDAPNGDITGQNRANRAAALKILAEAGYVIRNGRLVARDTGQPLQFEILVARPVEERLALVYRNMLERTGISVSVRNVDASQYQGRLDAFDYDMIFFEWAGSLSPGNEQQFRWGTQAADQTGSYNFAGVKDPAVDAMISALLSSRTRPEFVSSVRALDRVLLSGNYVIPLFFAPQQWVALWDKVQYPAKTSLYGYRSDSWWATQKK
ncbi:MAG: extracellular solute-binding protein [Parvibaculaceae bacterium]